MYGVDCLPILPIPAVIRAPHGDEQAGGEAKLDGQIPQARTQCFPPFLFYFVRIIFDLVQFSFLFFFGNLLIVGTPRRERLCER